MSKKVNWATVDKRISRRRVGWTNAERASVETVLQKLPDLADQVEYIDIAQPAIGTPEADDAADESADALN